MAVSEKTVGPLQVDLIARGTHGISFYQSSGTPEHEFVDRGTPSSSPDCRVIAFSPDGTQLAWCDGKSVNVVDSTTLEQRLTIPKSKTRHLQFSPLGTYIVTWEPYAILQGQSTGDANLEIWAGGEKAAEFIQKSQQNWCPQWSDDEQLCARNVTNEVHCYDGGLPGHSVSRKLQVENLATFALSQGKAPCRIACYVPGMKGAPSFVRLYEYPRLEGPGSILANKSFYRADSVTFVWNKKGSALLVLTSTETDKTGASYYGEQGLHYLSVRGDGNMVPLSKRGPIYSVEWNPDSEDFCVVYGFMPSCATLFNCKCEPVFEFGTAHRNCVNYNPQGNIICLSGFGNLKGSMEFWDRKQLKLISSPQAPNTTQLEWSPDGIYVATATNAPRLRVDNGFKIWHFTGSLLFSHDVAPKKELWEVKWRPAVAGSFPPPDPTQKPPPSITQQKAEAKQAAAYVPPALRGKSRPKGDMPPPKAPQGGKRRDQRGGRDNHSSEQIDAIATAKSVVGEEAKDEGSEKEKKIKQLKKKLRQIEQIRQQAAEGKVLEVNQVEKIGMEQAFLEELRTLELS